MIKRKVNLKEIKWTAKKSWYNPKRIVVEFEGLRITAQDIIQILIFIITLIIT